MLLDYESDAIAAEKAGDPVQYIVPKQTILIQTPIAVTSKSSHSAQAQAFVNWLWSPAGADDLGAEGLPPGARARSPSSSRASSRRRRSLFTIKTLGGWTKVKKTFFGSVERIDHEDRAGRGGADCLQLTQ